MQYATALFAVQLLAAIGTVNFNTRYLRKEKRFPTFVVIVFFTMKAQLSLLRPKHIVKNILVLLPLIFSGKLLVLPLLVRTLIAVVIFSLLASVIYIVNDLLDAPMDRLHPSKKNRPIASGAVSETAAKAEAAIVLILLIALSVLISLPYLAWMTLLAYLVINLAYSLGLKNVPILDIALLASGFLLRVFFGSAVTGIAISGWLYLTVLAVSFYLGLGKRRNELSCQSDKSRKVLSYYTYEFLDKNLQLFMVLAVVFYSLWALDDGNPSSHMLWTVPLLLCLCLKYSLDIEGDSDGDPIEVIFRDKALLLLGMAFAALTFILLYCL